MWRLTNGPETPDHPLLHTLNGKVGRQVWVFDSNAGTPQEREQVEKLREAFTANRLSQKHSSDELLRCGDHVAPVIPLIGPYRL